MKDVIGYVAALFTTFSLLPQIIRIWKLKEARDISLFMPLMVSVGAVLWLVYGIMIAEAPVIAANAVSLLVALITLFITIKYR
jgi:MtN3 and saliva related transmembrane protein